MANTIAIYMTHLLSTKPLMFVTNETIVRAPEIMRKVARVSDFGFATRLVLIVCFVPSKKWASHNIK